jgi:hypothetical protein
MADLEPFDGDYTNTRVINNTLEAEENALMRVAIGLGAAVLSDECRAVLSFSTTTKSFNPDAAIPYPMPIPLILFCLTIPP